MRPFDCFIAIDWSGQAVARPRGLAVAVAGQGNAAPVLMRPDGGWSRPDILELIGGLAAGGTRALIGLDLSPAFPFADEGAFFPGWDESPADGRALWALVDRYCGDDAHLGAAGFLAHEEAARYFRQHGGRLGDRFGARRAGRFRVCEHGQKAMALSPYSCFNLVGAAQVGKSSLTGMRVLHRLSGRAPVWPFDPAPDEGPLIVEIYTSLAAREANIRKGLSKMRDGVALDAALDALGSAPHAPLARYDDHSTDAILTAAWLRKAATDPRCWTPAALTPQIAATEGWTFGVF